MENFLKDLASGLQDNQLLFALMGGGIFYQIVANLKSILGSIWSVVTACISFTVNSVTVGAYDPPLMTYKIVKVLSRSKVLWERHVELQQASPDFYERNLVNSAYKRSYRWMWGHFMILDRRYSTENTTVVMTVTARVFFARRRKFIERLMKEIKNCSLTDGRDAIVVNIGKNVRTEKPKRSIKSIYSNDGTPEKVLNDVKAFVNSRDVYEASSSPYKFVALMAGVPGSGKTSCIHAVASELSMGVRFVNTDDEDFDDIVRAMTRCEDTRSNLSDRNIIVIEDVDCISMNATDKRCLPENGGRSPKHGPKQPFAQAPSTLSLTSILNLLDGIITPPGTIVFLTSNNPDKLDPALLRDGRIDARYEFGNFNRETANRLVKDCLGFEIENIKDGITPSSIQRDALKVRIGRMAAADFKRKYSENPETGRVDAV